MSCPEKDREAAPGVWEEALALLGPEARGLVLDAPAGSGGFSAVLARRGLKPVALDINAIPEPLPRRVAGDLNSRLPFRDGAFDAVVCIEGIEHVENPRALLREFGRVLKPGGALVVTTPNVGSLRSRLKILLTGLPFWFGDRMIRRAFGHTTPLWAFQLRFFLESAGFARITFEANRRPLLPRLLSPLVRLCGALFRERDNAPVLLAGEILVVRAVRR